jgi:hypothetical protein
MEVAESYSDLSLCEAAAGSKSSSKQSAQSGDHSRVMTLMQEFKK